MASHDGTDACGVGRAWRESDAGRVAVGILVPGYGGRARVVERWRMAVALNTLAAHGCGRLVVSGYQGEAERLAALAPQGITISIEPTARSTFENVQRSLPFLLDAELIAIASDRGPRPVDQGTVPERSFERGPLGHHPRLLPPGVGGAAPLITALSHTIWQERLARLGERSVP